MSYRKKHNPPKNRMLVQDIPAAKEYGTETVLRRSFRSALSEKSE